VPTTVPLAVWAAFATSKPWIISDLAGFAAAPALAASPAMVPITPTPMTLLIIAAGTELGSAIDFFLFAALVSKEIQNDLAKHAYHNPKHCFRYISTQKIDNYAYSDWGNDHRSKVFIADHDQSLVKHP